MKTPLVTLIAAASAFVMALPASAQEATPDYPAAYTSSVSRDEVRDATSQARAAGQIVDGERSHVASASGMPLTRAQVVAELGEARRLGLVTEGEQVAVATEAQLQSITSAGLRATSTAVAAKQ
jgi:hypothetical protein